MRYSKLALAGFLILSASAAQAQSWDTVDWAPDTAVDGTGTGTLQGITYTYTTVSGRNNAGTTVQPDFPVSLGTSPVVSSVTHNTAGVLGATTAGQTHTITFSGTVTNPVLFLDYGDALTTFNFGATPISFLSSNNASLAGGVVTFPGATDNLNDGFAAQLTGVFGPGTPLVFTSISTGAPDTQAFTFGKVVPAGTPEPGTYALLVSSGLTGAAFLRRRKKAKKAL